MTAAAALTGAGCGTSHSARHDAVLLDPIVASRLNGPFYMGDRVGLGTWWIQVVGMSDPYQATGAPSGPAAQPGARLIRVDLHVGNQGSSAADLPAGSYLLRDDRGTDDPVDGSGAALPALPSRFGPGASANGSLVFSVVTSAQPSAVVFRPPGPPTSASRPNEIVVHLIPSLPH